MEHYFELPVSYKNETLQLNGRLVTFAYTYKFYIVYDGHEFVFEKDDEQNYRVLSPEAGLSDTINRELVQAIIHSLENLAEA